MEIVVAIFIQWSVDRGFRYCLFSISSASAAHRSLSCNSTIFLRYCRHAPTERSSAFLPQHLLPRSLATFLLRSARANIIGTATSGGKRGIHLSYACLLPGTIHSNESRLTVYSRKNAVKAAAKPHCTHSCSHNERSNTCTLR